MTQDLEHLKREIDELEKQISSHPFEGLFDRKRMEQLQDKLKKRRKALARIESGDDDENDHHTPQIELPDLEDGVLLTHVADIDEIEPPRRPVVPLKAPAAKPAPTPSPKPKAKAAMPKKAAKKSAAKSKPKPKTKAKSKPAKKKSKR